MSTVAPEILFKTMLISFSSTLKSEIVRLSALHVKVPDVDSVDLIISTIKSLPNELIIEKFIEKSFKDDKGNIYHFWKDVEARRQNELIDGISKIFGNLPNIKYINEILDTNAPDGTPYIPKDVKEKVFKFVDAMIKNSIKYIHLRREPYTDENGQRVYKHNYFDYVDVDEYIKLFKVRGIL